ncbi:hypothetical protein [Cohnella terricola]|uniref:Uncharacterized protein n=1 Tax=Cohnella terricola TaxID=1289167 RepID=A0A559JL69_9BACL|nr:hypothetical protein [Cohnella terricola]TVY00610.1 hypothetical protein FPZ45_11380 [Cohnella terricola]
MKSSLEQLLATTDDLLYRARIYDRNLLRRDELLRMGEMRDSLVRNRWIADNGPLRDRAVETLLLMRQRLITLLEDMLYTA